MEEVVIQGSGGVRIAGTMLVPDTVTTAALLLPGSGPQDRDETISGVKPLLHLAEQLSNHGIASLRCDDRGVGQSEGDYLAIDGDVLLEDANAQLSYLQERFKAKPVVVVGHSQGALFALRLARRSTNVTRVVLLGAGIVPGMQLLMRMREQMADDVDLHGEDRTAYLEHSQRLFETLIQVENREERAKAVRKLVEDSVEGASDDDFRPDFDSLSAYVDFAVADALEWEVREILRSDTGMELSEVAVPVLALWGALDRHVSAIEEQAAFDNCCPEGSASRVLPGMNHLFQKSQTGFLEEYGQDGQPMLNPVPQLVADWIRSTT